MNYWIYLLLCVITTALAQEPVPVTIFSLKRQSIEEDLALPGQVVAFQKAIIHTRTAGIIKTISANLGEHVEKGQELAELDHPLVLAKRKELTIAQSAANISVAQTKAELEIAKAKLKQLQNRIEDIQLTTRIYELYEKQSRFALDYAKVEYQKAQELYQNSNMPEAEYQKIAQVYKQREFDYEMAQLKLQKSKAKEKILSSDEEVYRAEIAAMEIASEQAQAKEAEVRAELDRTETEISQHHILSPFGGIVVKIYATPGVWQTIDQPLFEIADITRVRVKSHLPVADMSKLKIGISGLVKSDAYPKKTFEAGVFEISPVIEQNQQSFEMLIENADEELKPGMSVEVHLKMGYKSCLLIPQDCLIKSGERDEYIVFIVKDGLAHKVAGIPFGAKYNKMVNVLDGLEEGMQIIVAPLHLEHGQPVRIIGDYRAE